MPLSHESTKKYRFKDNPLEKTFADAWAQENDRPNDAFGSCTLAYLLSHNNKPVALTQQDTTVAASIVQWLGSPVGQNFLLDVLSGPEAKQFREELGKRTKK